MDGSVRVPALDPELAAVLAALPALTIPLCPEDITPMRARRAAQEQRAGDEALSRGRAVDVSEQQIAVSGGVERSVLILRPTAGAGPWPGVYYLHGGGMVMGSSRTGVEQILDWVVELGVVVVSMDYRLAPEYPHPVPVQDAYAGLCWLATHAGEWGIDGAPPVLAGTSAGGGLAAAVALMAGRRGGPPMSDLVLMSPMLDDRNDSGSSHQLEGTAVWDRRSNITGWDALLGAARGTAAVPAIAAPARAEDLTGMPATFLDVGAVETFRDEVLSFGTRLAAAGVPVEMHLWAGAFHGFDVFAPDSGVSRAARHTRIDYLRRRLVGRSGT